MKYTIATLAFGLGASAGALNKRGGYGGGYGYGGGHGSDKCCFEIEASGGKSGLLGQIYDGQNRIGEQGLPPATYCLNNGALTDASGRGCVITGPTDQFQCDAGAPRECCPATHERSLY